MRARGWVFGGVASLAFLAPSAALAQLSQPDGTPIPQGNGLQGLFDARGEAIDALAVASAVPETFQPSSARRPSRSSSATPAIRTPSVGTT